MPEDTLDSKVEALERELSRLRDELASVAQHTRDSAPEAEDAVREADNDTRPHIEREVQAAVEAGKRALHKLDEMAEKRPTGSLIVAFIVGLIVARFLGLGRSR